LYWFYQAALALITIGTAPIALPVLAAAHPGAGLGQRFGLRYGWGDDDAPGPRIWIHAASVGEVKAAAVVIDRLRDVGGTFFVSTMTKTGHAQAVATVGSQARVLFVPIDLEPIVRRVIRILRPDLYIGLETELWPALLRVIRRRNIPAVLLNGRLSQRSWHRLRRIRPLARAMLQTFSAIAAISDDDAHRIEDLGARTVLSCGNLKYDWQEHSPALSYRERLDLPPGTPVFLAGSTHTGEEEELIGVYRRLQAAVNDIVWICAPRHIERVPAIEELFQRHDLAHDRLSTAMSRGRRHQVVLVDTIGDLAHLYAVATAAFCGGSLVPKGGHNIMEAAFHGCPVFYGPHMEDFADARLLVETAGAGRTARTVTELADALEPLFTDKEHHRRMAERARTVAQRQRGAADRQIAIVRRLLTTGKRQNTTLQ